jgi:outer membrane protein assembly factor BamB
MKNGRAITCVMLGWVLLMGAASAWAQDWPQWRGPNRDNKVKGFAVPATWPKELSKQWQVSVGIGESSPLLVGDKVYVFARQDDDEVTLCLDAASGKEIWRDKYAAEKVKGAAANIGGGFKGTRSTPALAEGKICTLGVGGVVSCLDAATGKVVWRHDTKSKPQFYTSSSPLIVDGKCIVYVAALTAYDLASGESKWEWTGGGTPYGSPVLMTVDGAKQVVTPTVGAIAGISLGDGKPLWEVKVGGEGYQGNFSTPVIDGQTVIYSAAAKGKDAGTVAVKIDKQAEGYAATELWRKIQAAHQYHAPLLKDGLLYGVSAGGRNFFCWDAKTGDQLWIDSAQRGQCGSILDVGPVLVSVTSDKHLVAFKAGAKEYQEVAKYKVADAETWAIPILAGKRIFVKDRGGSLTLWTLE